jgi:deoxyribose-phosphate aldolase
MTEASVDTALAKMIDHTVLSPRVSDDDVAMACEEARRIGFAAVVVPPEFLRAAVHGLGGSGVRVCTVVSFPDGDDTPEGKAGSVKRLIKKGADEIDMVMNVKAYLAGQTGVIEDEIRRAAEAVHGGGAIVKVIIETALLEPQQIADVTNRAAECGADFVKTSTGRASRGATVEDVKVIREAAAGRVRIKASGGIRTREFAKELIAAGADRIGTSASVQIVGG